MACRDRCKSDLWAFNDYKVNSLKTPVNRGLQRDVAYLG
jgi:hypothetical protein